MHAAAAQAWPPFVLVAGLILVGVVAARDGLFAALGRALARTPGGDGALLLASLVGTAAVSAVLNLDTAAVFATPVLVLAARARGADERPFLYGALLLANAGSLFLPGSNLTNLLVLGHGHLAGVAFVRRLLPEALTAVTVTAAGVLAWQARLPPPVALPGRRISSRSAERLRPTGAVAALVAAVLILGLTRPALPVLAVGLLAAAVLVLQGRLAVLEIVRGLGPLVLFALFALAVAFGTLGRHWGVPAQLVREASAAPTAAVAALASVLVNNLPAAALFSAGQVPHPGALLLGLNVGPNLAVTGSLSSYLWWRSARSVGARPSAATLSRLGLVLAPAAIAAGLIARLLVGGAG